MTTDQFDRALADCDQAVRLKPDGAIVWDARGNVLYLKDEYDRAIADFSEGDAAEQSD